MLFLIIFRSHDMPKKNFFKDFPNKVKHFNSDFYGKKTNGKIYVAAEL